MPIVMIIDMTPATASVTSSVLYLACSFCFGESVLSIDKAPQTWAIVLSVVVFCGVRVSPGDSRSLGGPRLVYWDFLLGTLVYHDGTELRMWKCNKKPEDGLAHPPDYLTWVLSR